MEVPSLTSSCGVECNCEGQAPPQPAQPTKRIVKSKAKKNKIPNEILENKFLNETIALLPLNYNFEIHKTVWRIVTENSKLVALQFPEGLLMYACIISDIISKFCGVETIILGDVTYGACCVDDFTACKLGADILIHYGHSCLVPIDNTKISTMYVFVEIHFDNNHLVRCIADSFPRETKIALMGTIQFVSILHSTRKALLENHEFKEVVIPQARPLSMGETLGCTAPLLSDSDILVFVADGRFHLEAAMIMNPSVAAYRYDPYTKIISREGYDVQLMKSIRFKEICKARDATTFGLILGSLGRQGNVQIFERMRLILERNSKVVIPFIMAEINPVKLASVSIVDAWVQIACPRLSMDWGAEFGKPILSSYELEVCMGTADWLETYPMDYYKSGGGTWGNMANR